MSQRQIISPARAVVGSIAAIVVVVVAGLAAIVGTPLWGIDPPDEPSASTPAPETPQPDPDDNYAEAAATAASLPTTQHTAAPDYRRDEFGDGWGDLDGDGCTERQEVLQRDLADVSLDVDACTVLTGTLDDPYSGALVAFRHDRLGGDSQAVQIDHVVPLSYAWSNGAWAWSDQERLAFANDFANLLAVDGSANAGKGDSGPGSWMPDDVESWCAYASMWVTVLDRYELTTTTEDRTMLIDVLEGCAA